MGNEESTQSRVSDEIYENIIENSSESNTSENIFHIPDFYHNNNAEENIESSEKIIVSDKEMTTQKYREDNASPDQSLFNFYDDEQVKNNLELDVDINVHKPVWISARKYNLFMSPEMSLLSTENKHTVPIHQEKDASSENVSKSSMFTEGLFPKIADNVREMVSSSQNYDSAAVTFINTEGSAEIIAVENISDDENSKDDKLSSTYIDVETVYIDPKMRDVVENSCIVQSSEYSPVTKELFSDENYSADKTSSTNIDVVTICSDHKMQLGVENFSVFQSSASLPVTKENMWFPDENNTTKEQYLETKSSLKDKFIQFLGCSLPFCAEKLVSSKRNIESECTTSDNISQIQSLGVLHDDEDISETACDERIEVSEKEEESSPPVFQDHSKRNLDNSYDGCTVENDTANDSEIIFSVAHNPPGRKRDLKRSFPEYEKIGYLEPEKERMDLRLQEKETEKINKAPIFDKRTRLRAHVKDKPSERCMYNSFLRKRKKINSSGESEQKDGETSMQKKRRKSNYYYCCLCLADAPIKDLAKPRNRQSWIALYEAAVVQKFEPILKLTKDNKKENIPPTVLYHTTCRRKFVDNKGLVLPLHCPTDAITANQSHSKISEKYEDFHKLGMVKPSRHLIPVTYNEKLSGDLVDIQPGDSASHPSDFSEHPVTEVNQREYTCEKIKPVHQEDEQGISEEILNKRIEHVIFPSNSLSMVLEEKGRSREPHKQLSDFDTSDKENEQILIHCAE